jgi:hypothetical protein
MFLSQRKECLQSIKEKMDAVQSSLRSHNVYQGVSLRGQTEEIKRLIDVLTTRLDQLLAVSGDPYSKEVLEKERQGASQLQRLVVIKDH